MITNLNKELPIKNYADIVAGMRGYYHEVSGMYCTSPQHTYTGNNDQEACEIVHEFRRIGRQINTPSKLMAFTGCEECNYWSETEHFYYWTRLNPQFVGYDYAVHIKAYRKEN